MRTSFFISVAIIMSVFSAQQVLAQQSSESLAVTNEPEATEAPTNVTAEAVHYTCKDYFEHKFNSAARENVGRKSSCVSYFFGAGSMLLLLNNKGFETGACPAETMSTDELIRIFNSWMESHPEQKTEIATSVLYDAIKYNYPCSGIVPLGSE